MASNDLVLSTHDEQDEHDDLLASIGELAHAAQAPVAKPTPRSLLERSKYRSRFFFELSGSFVEEVKRRKKAVVKSGQDHVDAEITKRLALYKKTMPIHMAANIEAVREFFLTEIAPITIAIGAGSDQARDVVQRLLGSQVDGTQFAKFERMNAEAVNIRMAKFVAKQFKLPVGDVQRLLASISPAQHQQPFMPLPVPHQQPTQEGAGVKPSPYESRHAKAKRKRKEESTEERKASNRA